MEYDKMISELEACAQACNVCFTSCLNEEDVSLMARCIELTRECAEACQIAASMVARDSENADKFLRLSAEITMACDEECSKHQLEHCQNCAKICRRCSVLCLERAAVLSR
jgi:hypothetical protein